MVSLADDEVSVTVIEENVHVAEEFVAEIDAESMEEADIESFIDDRRGRHALIRRRIEARRREQLADIRSETAKIYQSADGNPGQTVEGNRHQAGGDSCLSERLACR